MRRTMMTGALTALLAFAGLSVPALAGPYDVVVEGAWARASIGTSRPGAAYMTIRNSGEAPVTLIGLATPLAMMPEIHETQTNAEGVSSMSPAGEITIAPNASVALEPGGLHAMLMRLREPMMEGGSFPLALRFADGSEVSVEVPIFGVASRGPEN